MSDGIRDLLDGAYLHFAVSGHAMRWVPRPLSDAERSASEDLPEDWLGEQVAAGERAALVAEQVTAGLRRAAEQAGATGRALRVFGRAYRRDNPVRFL